MRCRKGSPVALLGCALAVVVGAPWAWGQEPAARSSRKPRPFASSDTPKQRERVRQFDVRHVKAELTLDPKAAGGAGEVRGTVTHTVAPVLGALTSVTLDCGAELKVSKVTAGPSGKPRPCTFSSRGDALTVTLDRAYADGEVFDLAVTYAGTPRQGLYLVPDDPSDPGRPACYWTQGEPEETRHWLPCYDFPNDRATSEMIITVPKPMRVLSNGKLIESKENPDGTVTDHWRIDVPHSSYLISLVATEFTVVRDRHGDLPVDYYLLKNHDEATARRAFDRTPRMLAYFEQATGQKYPFPKYSQVAVPEFTMGGMENISATTMNEFLLGDAITALERDHDGVVAHELAHQWFGDLVTCRDWSHIWLNEGFATYFAQLWTEHDEGADAFRLGMEQEMRSYLGMDTFVRRSIVESRYRGTMQMFDSVTYAKGACVLHMLRGLIGDDAWWRGVRGYLARHREQVVETDDLRRAMEEASGRDLAWYFDQWVHHGGHPELKARWRYETEDKTLRLAVEQVQNVDDLTPLFRLPTTVEFDDGATTRSVPIVIDGKTHEFALPCETAPRNVRIDPKGWLVKELEFEKPAAAWLHQLEHAADAPGRLEAARALAKRKDDEAARKALAGAWSREQLQPARQALVQLLASSAETYRPALLAAARDPSPRVRSTALQGLSGLKHDDELEALFRAVWSRSDETYSARRTALRTLSKWKVKDRDALIAAALATRSDRETLATAALDLLIDGGGRPAREAAVRYSRPDQPFALRRPAVLALGRMAQEDPQLQPVLVELVGDPSRNLRRTVLGQLSGRTYPGTIEALESVLKRETQARARDSITSAIASIKEKQLQGAKAGGPKPTPAVAVSTTAPAAETSKAAALEKQAAALQKQLDDVRKQLEALKKPAATPSAAGAP